jgi:hypothetical protein
METTDSMNNIKASWLTFLIPRPRLPPLDLAVDALDNGN